MQDCKNLKKYPIRSESIQENNQQSLLLVEKREDHSEVKKVQKRASLSHKIIQRKESNETATCNTGCGLQFASYLSKEYLTGVKIEKHSFERVSNARLINEHIQQLRGGRNEELVVETLDNHVSSLLDKIAKHRMRIQNENRLTIELKFYIEPLAKALCNSIDIDLEPSELTFEIQKRFLDPSSVAKVLLLTGEAGIGKTLFCRHLQKTLLDSYDDPHKSANEIGWIPIFIDLSYSKQANPDMTILLSEILKQELSLTESEIELIQGNDSNNLLAKFVFIFDGYDHLTREQYKASTVNDYIQNNFCILSGFENFWRSAKIIVASRSEAFTKIPSRELLFGPIDMTTNKVFSGSFLEFVLQPFNDVQISSYLKRYTVSSYSDLQEEGGDHQKLLPLLQNSKSWSLVSKYEELIDSCGARELVRVPLNLYMSFKIFSDFISEIGQPKKDPYCTTLRLKKDLILTNTAKNKIQSETLQINQRGPKFKMTSRRRLYELFINRSITATAKKMLSGNGKQVETQEDEQMQVSLFEKIRLQLQNIALGAYICKYAHFHLETEIGQKEHNDRHSLINSCPLLKFGRTPLNQGNQEIIFSHKSYKDFFVASKLEEEILGKANEEEDPSVLREMYLNQKLLLIDESESLSILQFLADSIKDKKITPADLVKLIEKTKTKNSQLFSGLQKQDEQIILESTQDSYGQTKSPISLPHRNHPFSIAAANAITLLNFVGFDFSHKDFSEVCIAGANLSHGVFERADFTGADLQGVNFSGSFLKDAKFVGANMSGVQFGLTPDLNLEQEAFCLAHSPNGNYLAIGTKSEIIVFEKQINQSLHFQEVKRLKGHAGDVYSCSFSADSKHLLSGAEDGTIRIWDIRTGECEKILRGHNGSVTSCDLSQDGQHIISVGEDQTIQKWDCSEGKWALTSFQIKKESVSNCLFKPNANAIICSGGKNLWPMVYHSITGQYIRRYQYIYAGKGIKNCKFNSDDKQIAIEIDEGKIFVLDSIRGHLKNYFRHQNYSFKSSQMVKPLLSRCGSWMISTNKNSFKIHKIAACGGHELKYFQNQIRDYTIDPLDHTQIVALLDDNKVISIKTKSSKSNPIIVTGANLKGLNLTGVNIDASIGLSEVNLKLFKQHGDYSGIEKEKMHELILNSSKSDMEKLVQIDLSNRNLEPRGVTVISRNFKRTNLQKLDLSMNGMSDESAVEIALNGAWTNLQELILNANRLSDKGLVAISANSIWKHLRKLYFKANRVSSLGAASLGMNSIWKNLEELDLSQNEIGEEGAIAIGCNASWRRLKRLDLSFNKIGDKGAEAIARNYIWIDLEELGLSDNNIGDMGAAEIGQNKVWTNLKILSLERNRISDLGASVIVDNTTWVGLEELYLYYNNISHEISRKLEKNNTWPKMRILICFIENQQVGDYLKGKTDTTKIIDLRSTKFSDIHAIILGRFAKSSDLEELLLYDNEIGDKGAVAIGSNTSWSKLRISALGSNRISDEGALAVGSNTTWVNIEELSLYNNQIGDQGAVAIGNNATWRRIRRLFLQKNRISDEGAIAIGENKTWVRLEELYLHENDIGDKGAIAIGKNEVWTKLKKLSLSANKIRNEGAITIGSNEAWINLQELSLDENEIGDKGAIILGKNVTWRKLKELYLDKNRIGDYGAISIGSNGAWTDLEELWLSENEIGDKGAVVLGNNTNLKKLRSLILSKNKIGDEGAISIGSNTTWTNLEELWLSENIIGDKGAIALGKNVAWTKLRELSLYQNRIGDEGAIAIGSNVTWVDLEYLSLMMNEISDRGAIGIAKNTTWCKLKILLLAMNKIRVEGFTSIAENTTYTGLRELDIYHNNFNSDDEQVILKAFSYHIWKDLSMATDYIASDLKNLFKTSQTATDISLISKALAGTYVLKSKRNRI